MLMPSASVSVANTIRTRPRTNSSSTVCRKVGSIPAWCEASPRRSPSRHSCTPSTSRSAGASSVRWRSTIASTSPISAGVRSEIPDRRHCARAASQPTREKMKPIAGSSPSRSSRVTRFGRESAGPRPSRRRGAPPRPRPRPRDDSRSSSAIRIRCRIWRLSSGLTRGRVPALRAGPVSAGSNRSNSRCPTSMCWDSGTGRCSSTITEVSPRTVWIQSPNSSALLTVADRLTTRTDGSRCRITSSHTAPRNRSARKWTSSMTTWDRPSRARDSA